MDSIQNGQADCRNVIVIRCPSHEFTEEDVVSWCAKYGPIDRSARVQGLLTGEDAYGTKVCVCFIRISDAEKAFHRLRCKGLDVRWLTPRRIRATSPMKKEQRKKSVVDMLRNITSETSKYGKGHSVEAASRNHQAVADPSSRKRRADKDACLEVPEKIRLNSDGTLPSCRGEDAPSISSLIPQNSGFLASLSSKPAVAASSHRSRPLVAADSQQTIYSSCLGNLRQPGTSNIWAAPEQHTAPLTVLAPTSLCQLPPAEAATDKWIVPGAARPRQAVAGAFPIPVVAAGGAANPWRYGAAAAGAAVEASGRAWIPQAHAFLPVSSSCSVLNGATQLPMTPSAYPQVPTGAGPPALFLPCVPAPSVPAGQPWNPPVLLVASEQANGLVHHPQMSQQGRLAPTLVLAPVPQLAAAPALFAPPQQLQEQQQQHQGFEDLTSPKPTAALKAPATPLGRSFENQMNVLHQKLLEKEAKSLCDLSVAVVPSLPSPAALYRDVETPPLESGSSARLGNSAARKSLPFSKTKAIESRIDAFLKSEDSWSQRLLDSRAEFEVDLSAMPSV